MISDTGMRLAEAAGLHVDDIVLGDVPYVYVKPHLSSPSWSATLDDAVERDGLYYEKFTDVPYTGGVTGSEQGSFKGGVKDGSWLWYWSTGQLAQKGSYKNGKWDGAWVTYYQSGKLWSKGNYKNDLNEGAEVYYYENGQLDFKGNYENGKREGAWASYNEDGTVNKEYTGTYNNNVKISD